MESKHDFRTWIGRRIRWLGPLGIVVLILSQIDWNCGSKLTKQQEQLKLSQFEHPLERRAELAKEHKVKVVCAVADIADGATIEKNLVEEKEIEPSSIPPKVVSLGQTKQGDPKAFFPTYYLNSKSDAIGRLSKGIRKGQILFASFAGFRGDTVVFATKDIPESTIITGDCVVEKEINPRDIPVWAVSFQKDAIGKHSMGISKGQVIIYVRARYDILSGDFPGEDINWITYPYVYATRPIPVHSIIKASDVHHGTPERHPKVMAKDDIDFARHPEGRKAKFSISPGQVILNSDVEAETPQVR